MCCYLRTCEKDNEVIAHCTLRRNEVEKLSIMEDFKKKHPELNAVPNEECPFFYTHDTNLCSYRKE